MGDDEVVALLCQGIRDMGESIEPAHISYEDDVKGRIRYEGPLPEMLRPGVIVARFNSDDTIAETGRRAGDSIRILRSRAEELAKGLSKGLGKAARMTGSTPEIVVITHEPGHDGEHRLEAIVEVATLDEMLRPTTTSALLNEHGFDAEIATMRTLRGQLRRRAALSRGVVVERTLAYAAGEKLKPLILHLMRMPRCPEAAAWESGEWTAKRLAQHGIHLPGGIETVCVKDGRVAGRVRLAPNTTWNDGRLLHRMTIPETAIQSLPGKPLGALIEHEALLPDVVIRKIGIDGHDQLRVKTDPVDVGLPF